MLDYEMANEYLDAVADKYTAAELAEELDLDVWDIIEFFREKILESGIKT